MRILMIGHYPPHRGGVARHVKDLVDYLSREHEVHVITYGTVKGKGENVSYVKVPNIFGLRGTSFTLLASKLGVKLHKKLNFDLIHAHYVGTTSYAGVLIKERTGLPLVVTAHGSDLDFTSKLPLGSYYVKKSLIKANAVIAVSHYLGVKAKMLGAENVKVIPNWVTKTGKSRGEYIAFIGRLTEYKDFIELAKLFPQEKFVVAGEGPLLKKLMKESPKNVKFLGYKPSEDVLSKAKVLILPSKREGFGLVILEANSFKVPSLGRRVGGIREIIRDGKNGYTFSALDEAYEYLKELLNPKKGRKAGAISYRISRFYSMEESCKRILKVYEEVVG